MYEKKTEVTGADRAFETRGKASLASAVGVDLLVLSLSKGVYPYGGQATGNANN